MAGVPNMGRQHKAVKIPATKPARMNFGRQASYTKNPRTQKFNAGGIGRDHPAALRTMRAKGTFRGKVDPGPNG